MDKIIELFGNIKGGPKTTILGAVFVILGVFIMYTIGFEDVKLSSAGVVFTLLGGFLFVSKDAE